MVLLGLRVISLEPVPLGLLKAVLAPDVEQPRGLPHITDVRGPTEDVPPVSLLDAIASKWAMVEVETKLRTISTVRYP
jgi:hypothetical protein